MRYIDILTAFEMEINKIDDTLNKPLVNDSLYWLNQAVLKFCKIRFSGSEPSVTSYEQTEKRTVDLLNLYTTQMYEYPNDITMSNTNPDYDKFDINGIAKLSFMLGFIPYCILFGHKHYPATSEINGIKLVQSGSFPGSGDDHTVELRLSGKPSQTVLVCNESGIECNYTVELEQGSFFDGRLQPQPSFGGLNGKTQNRRSCLATNFVGDRQNRQLLI